MMLEAGCGIRQAARALGMNQKTAMRYRKAWGLPAPSREARERWAAQNPGQPADPERARLLAELAAAVAEINADAQRPEHEQATGAPAKALASVPPPLRMLLHTFYLRRGVPFQVSLPEDFRREEAERFCRLLQVLAVPEAPDKGRR